MADPSFPTLAERAKLASSPASQKPILAPAVGKSQGASMLFFSTRPPARDPFFEIFFPARRPAANPAESLVLLSTKPPRRDGFEMMLDESSTHSHRTNPADPFYRPAPAAVPGNPYAMVVSTECSPVGRQMAQIGAALDQLVAAAAQEGAPASRPHTPTTQDLAQIGSADAPDEAGPA